jgi:hypothetical protein
MRVKSHRLKEWLLCHVWGRVGCSVANCSETALHRLNFDHINGGGNQERQPGGHGNYERGGTNMVYRFLMSEGASATREKYQPLCLHHHADKTYENKEYASRDITNDYIKAQLSLPL